MENYLKAGRREFKQNWSNGMSKKVKRDDSAYEIHDAEYEKFVEECAKECTCCPDCWDVPCGGCLSGGICDNICFCNDKEDYAIGDADENEDWE